MFENDSGNSPYEFAQALPLFREPPYFELYDSFFYLLACFWVLLLPKEACTMAPSNDAYSS